MASGLRNLLVRIGADASQMKTEMKKAQSTLSGFQSGIKGIVGKIAATLATIGVGSLIKDATSDAMKFEAMMGTLSETLGSSMNDFVKWQDTVGRSLGFSKLQSAELANTLSLNFKAIATSQQDLVNKTTKMMETAAVIANKRGMAMSEVSDRIRSAMNQEADGADELGVNVRASAIMQGEAYKQMANGTPWAQLSSNQQKAILYQHILNSVSQNYGDTLQNNTAMKMSMFTAALLDVRLALGQAFLPALNAVLPYLTAFANAVAKALGVVAAFMQALFGHKKKVKDATKTFDTQTKTTNKQTASVGKLGDQFTKTGKKVKKAVDTMKSTLAGFDALNVLSTAVDNIPDPSTGGSGGTGGSGVGGVTVPPIEVPPVEIKVDMSSWNSAKKIVTDLANDLKAFANPIINTIFKPAIQGLMDALNPKTNPNMQKLIDDVGKFKTAFEKMGKSIKDNKTLQGYGKAVHDLIYNIAYAVTDKMIKGIDATVVSLTSFANVIDRILKQKDYKGVGEVLKKAFNDAFTKPAKIDISAMFDLTGLIIDPKTFFEKLLIKESWKSAIDLVKKSQGYKDFKKLWDVADWGVIVPKIKWSIPKLPKINVPSLSMKILFPSASSLTNVVTSLAKAVKKALDKSGIFSGMANALSASVKGTLNKFIDKINGFIKKINDFGDKIDAKLPGNQIKHIPTIPKLAKGGITTGSTIANIGEAGREAVLPLENNTGWMKDLASQLAHHMGGGGGDVIIQIGGKELGRIALNQIIQLQRQTGKPVLKI